MRLPAIFLAAVLATPVAGFTAINRHEVHPLGVVGAFEVISRVGSGPRDFWCAAGQYAADRLGHGNNARIYILAGYGPSQIKPGKRAVAFTLDARGQPAPKQVSSVSMREVGYSLTTALSSSFCSDVFDRHDRSLWPFP